MKEKIFVTKIFAVISAVVIFSFALTTFLQDSASVEILDNDGVPKAAIIDQLSDEIPNKGFQSKASEYLKAAGYEVDIITSKDVTVDFYKKLPQMNYKYIVVRTHGTADSDENSVVLFTGERYTEDKYISEQLFGHVKRATPLYELDFVVQNNEESEWLVINDTYKTLRVPANPIDKTKNEFFAISPKLVDELMKGKFSETTFILGGCSTMENNMMAKSLVQRGAAEVIGWDDTVGSGTNDTVMLNLLRENLINNLEMQDAVESVMQDYIPYWKYPDARMKYYSEST